MVVPAAMLHDLGKATHAQTEADGRITSHRHAEAGVEPTRDFLTRIGAPGHVHDKVLPIIREHICHASTGPKPTGKAVRHLVRRLAGENGTGPSIEDWARVVDADVTGRGAGNKVPFGEQWVALARRSGRWRSRALRCCAGST
ncbi:HD domain-containing protein [Sinomonas sp. G460-2]|uniref:HD domain-containing protein n=1 Tax=Sinomonas sp. G460-2 TaxID=3393464 RepID=UPI0039F06BDE